MEYALKNNSQWPGEIWWLKKNWRGVFWNLFILAIVFLIFRPLVCGNVLKNGDHGIAFGLFFAGQDLSFEIPTKVVFEIFIAITAYAMGYAGSDQLVSWLSGSAPMIKEAINQNSSNDPKNSTPLPEAPTPARDGDAL